MPIISGGNRAKHSGIGAAAGGRFLCNHRRRSGQFGHTCCRDAIGVEDDDGIRPADQAAAVQVSAYQIAPGATLPVHKHPFPRYAYVEAGTLKVTNVETGSSNTYKTGDFIVEMIGQWHQATNIGSDPVKLLVIDQVEQGAKNTILKQ